MVPQQPTASNLKNQPKKLPQVRSTDAAGCGGNYGAAKAVN
ncbi:hypothetical protein [Arthrobacter sp. DR-2P]|nr:hypothetical protein [Arthrobacter sp. DR-2P]